ncbi:PAS and helix-turn-helix domain-containing protein [Devosia rhodophyticola]|uniref:PAS and helix-turn-helix domain-containing protein n=1 Tax=Devosia rhodophyticola TaxID=3026423 RepID=A0ABY7Z119_9HYPH|nr:PAS and helix-turn-helix domain-containing protein [Devosia rhodophyticola]WDR06988.1 PAS and helix-turn-helix domain-containing protein [Devosia rhodophyticola]
MILSGSPHDQNAPSATVLQFSLADIPVPMVYASHRIIRDCNAEFAFLFGLMRQDLIGQSFSRLYPEIADFVRTGEMWRHHLPGGQVYYDERIMSGAGGRRFWCRVNGRSQNLADPFAEALYCFEPMARPVTATSMSLTGRQRQILTLVAQGKTNAVIATEMGLSRRTIEAHRARLIRTTGVRNSAELTAWFSLNHES